MEDGDRSEEQLSEELAATRRRIAELEASEVRRERTEKAFQESEARYRDLFENANDLIQSVGPDASFQYVNRAWKETMRYSDDEVSVLSVFDIIHPSNKTHCMEVFQRVMGGENIERVEAVFVTQDGRAVAVEGSINCRFEEGRPVATRAIFRDITARRQAEEEREALQRLSQRLTGPLSIQEVGRIVAEESRRQFGYDAFALDLLDESGQKLLGVHYEDTPLGAAKPEEVDPVQGDMTPQEREVLAGQPKLVNRDEGSEDGAGIPFGYASRRSRSLMFVPIRWRDRSVGVLSVQSYTFCRYSERDLSLLQTFADQFGGALARVQAEEKLKALYGQLQEANRRLEGAYLQMRDQKDRLSALLYRDEAAFLVDGDGTIRGITEKALERVGRSRIELLGTPILDVLDKASGDELKDAMRQAWIGASHYLPVRVAGRRADSLTLEAKMMLMNLEGEKMLLVLMREPGVKEDEG